jgi:hypothetical protein
MLLRNSYNTLLSSKLDNAELDVLTILYSTPHLKQFWNYGHTGWEK